MNKLVVFGVLGLFLVSFVSSYYCIQEEDNESVKQFKNNINVLALKQDIKDHDLTEEQFRLKIKYFGPCNKW